MQTKTNKLKLGCYFVLVLLAAGCETGPSSRFRVVIPGTDVPLYTQNQEVTLFRPFKLKIERAYWADEVMKFGYTTNLPPAFQRQFVAKPSAKFLVLEFSLTNLGQEAKVWNQDSSPRFMLENVKNMKYAPVGPDINMEDFHMTVARAQSGINPGMSIKGKLVYDVPKDDYVMVVSMVNHVGNAQYVIGPTLFKWSLSPKEKPE